ncbi:MAG: imidazole glycerol phosphate synthase subunit HisH, partial [Verrucomicrobia bacterium]|nr:imidazole glycerol phosphate synthase subunit HisH [Verrucomicrobiota bacterium]
MKVALIDYGAGNLRSVANALRALGHEPAVFADADGLCDATHLLLPGVGSFGDCMAQLEQRGLADLIRGWVSAGRPYLGICLGYQILFDSSDESPGAAGLGLFRGNVKRFGNVPGVKIPHMGWNAATPTRPDLKNWAGLGEAPYFYFVHSYFPVPEDDSIVATRTDYAAENFASSIESGAVMACQFHP